MIANGFVGSLNSIHAYISARLVPVGYGIKKLQITCVVEDEKVSTEVLEEQICEFEDYVSNFCHR